MKNTIILAIVSIFILIGCGNDVIQPKVNEVEYTPPPPIGEVYLNFNNGTDSVIAFVSIKYVNIRGPILTISDSEKDHIYSVEYTGDLGTFLTNNSRVNLKLKYYNGTDTSFKFTSMCLSERTILGCYDNGVEVFATPIMDIKNFETQ